MRQMGDKNIGEEAEDGGGRQNVTMTGESRNLSFFFSSHLMAYVRKLESYGLESQSLLTASPSKEKPSIGFEQF